MKDIHDIKRVDTRRTSVEVESGVGGARRARFKKFQLKYNPEPPSATRSTSILGSLGSGHPRVSW